MKKFLLMLVFATSCVAFTSCSSNGEKAAKDSVESKSVASEDNVEESAVPDKKAQNIFEEINDTEELEKAYAKALDGLALADTTKIKELQEDYFKAFERIQALELKKMEEEINKELEGLKVLDNFDID